MSDTTMKDGFSTTISVAGLSFREKGVKPPGLDGGDGIDITTMRNTKYRTKWPKSLIGVDAISTTVSYESSQYGAALAAINVNGAIVVTLPDSHTITVYGFIQKFEPTEHKEGTQPEAALTLCITNMNGDTEAGPVYA